MKADLIDIALDQYGVTEIYGPEDNPLIVKYARECDFPVSDDETAWCSVFVNWVCMKAGYERSGEMTALSWLLVGKPTLEPERGDIVVLWREKPNSWKGHVGFYIAYRQGMIYILGGNQKNSVSIQPYPYERLRGYRKLQKII